MEDERPLPEPYSEELLDALRTRNIAGQVFQLLYACLYDRRDDPPTTEELTEFVFRHIGKRPSQLQRRRRQLAEVFEQEKGDGFTYRLVGWASQQRSEAAGINRKTRFRVLQSGRCAACGRTVEHDGVILRVDHILPQAWGGSDELDNLQPLCDDCNAGKKDWYGTFDEFQAEISAAATYDEPHRRIAMLLGAFGSRPIPSALVGAVASAKQFQEDWQKRMRELREIGIDYETRKHRSPSGRVVSEYVVTRWVPPPDEPLAPLIRRLERQKRSASAD